ncbi:unnamed protein product (macronuclear) [Paramecium tetraurelia]|uniref:Srp40 C-terminal domain-containing protein n=1 Tax=Paramecium tetraurelia TaxID=5888 RepID=A0BG62_PARTE|nr:uncharacterized protein GSPATT00028564001 [Paramecium tetraurelia]CAK57529.1 unnamed protein product [Paramecium tetraurelia]|eukprot:XP_001424927.1 hypothetical protein (macronuclear) [Paramecium tetraurelia strain d4-2]
MQRDLTPQDVLPLIVEYLRSIGLKKSAKQIDSLYEHDETPMTNKDLQKIIKYYVEGHPKLAAKFVAEAEHDEQEEQEEEETDQPKEEAKNNKQSAKQLTDKRTFIQMNIPITEEVEEKKEKKRFFQKCDETVYEKLPDHLRDNTFEAKKKFGEGDQYGEFGNEKLKFTRGDNFKKEKGKLKNRQFQGMGSINLNSINSIKL